MTSSFFNSEKLPFCYKPSKARRMRVADILLLDDDDGGDFDCGGGSASMDGDRGAGCGGSIDYLSPRRVIGRWLKRLREKKVVAGKGKEIDELGDGSVLARSGSCRKETCFNVGVGFSLLYLVANSKNELNKITELREEMESFLQLAKELPRKDALSKLSEPLDNVAYSTTDIPEGSNSFSNHSVELSATSYVIPDSEAILEFDRSSRHDSPELEYSAEGMNQLEEELEAELERLQLHLETDTLLEHPQLQRIEVSIRDNARVESDSTTCGEVIDPQEAGNEEYYNGVPPCVLERKLHELLEARQEKHIQELEAALKCFQRKLHEKELEISWWKDTARLISQRIPGTSKSRHFNNL